jgi:hypothetical protein
MSVKRNVTVPVGKSRMDRLKVTARKGAGEDVTLRVWEAATGDAVMTVHLLYPLRAVAVHPRCRGDSGRRGRI